MEQKTSMNTVDLYAWLKENRDAIISKRISNVYHLPNSKKIFLKIKTEEYKFIVLEPSRAIYLSKQPYDMPAEPDILALSFRKYIKDMKISDIVQVGFDRFVKISFENGVSLYVELLPRGEIVLVDRDEKILHATEYKEMRDRAIKRGLRYSLPKVFLKPPSYEECVNISTASFDEKGFSKKFGIPNEVLQEALSRAKDKSTENVCMEIENILNESGQNGGYILYKQEKPFWFTPFVRSKLEKDVTVKHFKKFNDALDEYFYQLNLISEARTKPEEEKIAKNIEEIKKEIAEYQKKSLELYDIAKKMMEKYIEITDILNCVKAVQKEEGWEYVQKKCSNINSIDPSKGKVVISINGIETELSVYQDIGEQINALFEEAKKYKKKSENAQSVLNELENRLLNLQREREKELKTVVLRKKYWYEKFVWSFTRNGYLVIAGKNYQQNESIVKKRLNDDDIYLHADIHGAPSTILITNKKIVSEEDLYDAAVIAASYSKAWKIGLQAVDVFWVKGNQVSKTPPSGEYLEPGSFMIYGQKNYIKHVKLELYIGLQFTDKNEPRFFIGSQEAVNRHSQSIAIIRPGDILPEAFAKIIIDHLKDKGIDKLPPKKELIDMLPGKLTYFLL